MPGLGRDSARTRAPACVLFVTHTSRVSGAERTLLDLVRGLRSRGSRIVVACPPGRLADELRSARVEVVRVRGTDAGLKLHPVRTPLALLRLAADGLRVRRAARSCGAELVHANSTRAALIAAVARAFGGPPVVTHVHDVLGRDPVSRVVRRVILRASAVVLAISQHVADAVRSDGAPPVAIVGNPVDVERFAIPTSGEGPAPSPLLGMPPGAPVLAVVGQITPWKGQDVAIEALARLGREAHLLIVGTTVFATAGTRFDNGSYLQSLRDLARDRGVADRVHFLGEREDVPELLRATTVALVPSWEEPFGRVVIEAMAAGVPVIATSNGGPREILRDGGGVLAPPRDPAAWAAAITALLDDPAERARLGSEGRRIAAERYALDRFVDRVIAAYPASERRAPVLSRRELGEALEAAVAGPQERAAAELDPRVRLEIGARLDGDDERRRAAAAP